MADSTAVFTFQDPFQITDPSTSFFLENPDQQNTLNFEDDEMGREWDSFLDSEDPLSDPVIWALCNEDDAVIGNFQAGPSGFLEEGRSSNGINDNCTETPVFVDQSMLISVNPVPASQCNCDCCILLREITHTNGSYVKRLEIHGVFGVITHAVLGVYDYNTSFQTQDLQMFDFHEESAQTVKKFLVQYFEACKQEGFIPMQDPLSAFYEALSVGLNRPDNSNYFLQLSPENDTGNYQYNQQETMRRTEGGSNRQGGDMKIPLSMQRERTRNLKLKDFVDYFDLPIEEAARRMNLCPTVMKKICRKHGVPRWPYRKIKSIERKLCQLAKTVDASGNEERKRTQQGIQNYKQELANIYEPFKK